MKVERGGVSVDSWFEAGIQYQFFANEMHSLSSSLEH